ncbi:uncharacterized protein HKW66_Vig0164010 [Vigna angularis]|uniref:Uncharacterized protein n=1 Tax=Phaseolus angularis TaxID=3914 RepID=A0A8T0JLA7_PHAAN|nr:uncharacterized protein HKW66_Vig0164010 [Vigna angularis]
MAFKRNPCVGQSEREREKKKAEEKKEMKRINRRSGVVKVKNNNWRGLAAWSYCRAEGVKAFMKKLHLLRRDSGEAMESSGNKLHLLRRGNPARNMVSFILILLWEMENSGDFSDESKISPLFLFPFSTSSFPFSI